LITYPPAAIETEANINTKKGISFKRTSKEFELRGE
jgi:hypothetical protein